MNEPVEVLPRARAEDLAELERLRAEVEHLKGELVCRDNFIAIVSHELRNPLSPVFLQVQYLLDIANSEPETIDAGWLVPKLQKFSDRLDHVLLVLNRILDVSRVGSGRLELDLEEVDLAQAVRSACERVEPETAVARIQLRVHIPQPLLGRWDRLRLDQIFSNLLSNAIRYGAGNPVDVEVEAESKDTARLVVRDRGVGIAEEDQGRIFQRFERGPDRAGGGFGVGLWLVRELCAAMGGTIEVESRPRQGATFVVRLPRGGARSDG